MEIYNVVCPECGIENIFDGVYVCNFCGYIWNETDSIGKNCLFCGDSLFANHICSNERKEKNEIHGKQIKNR